MSIAIWYTAILVLEDGEFLIGVEMVLGYSKYPWEAFLTVSSRSNIRKFVKTPPILQVSSGVLEDRGVLDGDRDGVRLLKIPLRFITESFIKIQHQKAYHDSHYPSSILLESWRTWVFLMEVEMVSD